jgi:hypothetical protein
LAEGVVPVDRLSVEAPLLVVEALEDCLKVLAFL